MNYLIKKKSVIMILIMIVLLTSISVTTFASGEGLTDWKKVYYDFMTDYTRLYPDMNSEIIKSGDFGNPDFINGKRTSSTDLHPLYHKTENLKLINITGSDIPEIVSITYGNFNRDWVGSSTNVTNIQIYKYEAGKLKKIFAPDKIFLELFYKETAGNADIILKPGYPQYVDGSDDEPQISNLVWNEQKQELESITNDELTNLFYSSMEGRSNPDYLPKYFEDRGYKWIYYDDQETNDIRIEDDNGIRSHYIKYISESEIRSMLNKFPDDIGSRVTEEASAEKNNNTVTEKSIEGDLKEDASSSIWDRIVSFLRKIIFDPLSSLFSGDKDKTSNEEVNKIQNEELESKEEAVESLDQDYPSSKEGFRTYVNHKFGFIIDYPSIFKKDSSSNEDFAKFDSEDKKASLTATGKENISGQSLSELYQKDIDYVESISTVDYKASSNDWYVISWIHNGDTFYKRVYVGDGAINTMLMVSPENEGNVYNSFVEHISPSFTAGDLSIGVVDRNKNKKVETNKTVTDKSIDVSEVKPKIQKILDDSLGVRGIYKGSPVSEKDILRYFSQYMMFTNEKIDIIQHYNKDDTSWNVIPKDSVDKYSEKYFGRKVTADNHKQKGEIDFGWLEYYYSDQKYYFGFNPIGMRPETSYVVKEITQGNAGTIVAKVNEITLDGNGETNTGTYSIELEQRENRYIIKNIK